MHFESGYESFKKWGGIFVFEKQEKGSKAKKKKIISQRVQQLKEVKDE